jgi:hypothetical protein
MARPSLRKGTRPALATNAAQDDGYRWAALGNTTTLNGIGAGMFSAPNSASIMGAVPASQRGAASGMRATFQNSGTALSIGVFFSLMIAGLASSLPHTLSSGLREQGVPADVAQHAASLPPVSSLFATVLGENPVAHLLSAGGGVEAVPAANRAEVTGHEFFPHLLAGPFHYGLMIVFGLAAALGVLAAIDLDEGTPPAGGALERIGRSADEQSPMPPG